MADRHLRALREIVVNASTSVTPQQHQPMLGIAGFTENGTWTISEFAEFLQERNNSVIGLVERAAEAGLVRRENGAEDRRQVLVTLTLRMGNCGAGADYRSAAFGRAIMLTHRNAKLWRKKFRRNPQIPPERNANGSRYG